MSRAPRDFVNIIAAGTHAYFCGESPMARMYGFKGRFHALRAEAVHLTEHYAANADDPANRAAPRPRGLKGFARAWRGWSRRLRGKSVHGDRKPYLLWELEAIKPARD